MNLCKSLIGSVAILIALLSAAPALAAASYCSLPGELIAQDPAGDSATGVDQHDVRAVYWAELAPGAEGVDKIYVSLKVESLGPELPNSTYYVRFMTPDSVERWMSYNPYPRPDTPVKFRYGHIEVVGTVSNNVSDGPTDPESSAAADGTITWVLAKEKLPSLETGTFVTSIQGETVAVLGAFGSGLLATVDDTENADFPNGDGHYELRGNASCAGDSKSLLESVAGPVAPFTLLLLAALALVRRRT